MIHNLLDDADLQRLLADTLTALEAVPADALDAAYAAAGMGSLSEELATLVFDSGAELELAGMRGAAVEARLLSFVHEAVTVDLQLPGDDHVLVGQITPAPGGEVVIETDGGVSVPVVADEYGRFRVSVPEGAVRVRIVGVLVTPFVSR